MIVEYLAQDVGHALQRLVARRHHHHMVFLFAAISASGWHVADQRPWTIGAMLAFFNIDLMAA